MVAGLGQSILRWLEGHGVDGGSVAFLVSIVATETDDDDDDEEEEETLSTIEGSRLFLELERRMWWWVGS
ncbi:hypothetical protein E2C01_004613 [Portunus trituberculatus]|uniref:Uncharacterized protein n=1 Tax=Portunus trituberculatus TaxID=210409 RepID=A0A5B7CS67_PORTR|nr:hypothetical protein [Portunus trituberculatus]